MSDIIAVRRELGSGAPFSVAPGPVEYVITNAFGNKVTGKFTFSHPSAPGDDTRHEPEDTYTGCYLMPLTGDCAFQVRQILKYTDDGHFLVHIPQELRPKTWWEKLKVRVLYLRQQHKLLWYIGTCLAGGCLGWSLGWLLAALNTPEWACWLVAGLLGLVMVSACLITWCRLRRKVKGGLQS